MKFSLYELGLLYGDGHRFKKYGNERFLFTTTQDELIAKIESAFEQNEVAFLKFQRQHGEGKENWKPLHILETSDEAFLGYLEAGGFEAADAEQRFKKNPDFIRGYLETKGTLFEYKSRGIDRWRCSISGSQEDLEFLVDYLQPYIGDKRVRRRLDRAEMGVESESYRFSIDATEDLRVFLDFIKPVGQGEISSALMKKMNDFGVYWHVQKRKINPTYKYYRGATKAMAKELELTIGGIKGGSKSGSGKKPIYLQEGETVITSVNGWEAAFQLVSMIFEQVFELKAPTITSENHLKEEQAIH